jgi:hypothetical protein
MPMTSDLVTVLRASYREVIAAPDSLIDGNIANPPVLREARLMLPLRLHLASALVPASSLDHLVAGAGARHRLHEDFVQAARTGRRVKVLLRLPEDAEPAARAEFEAEPPSTRLQRATSFRCVELRDWDESAPEPDLIPAWQACPHATASARHRP